MTNVIDLATQRGAFRGNELKSVGELYEKISSFIKIAQEQAKKQASDIAPPEEAAPDTGE